MKAAFVSELGKDPVYGDFEEPHAEAGETLIHVTASALSHLTKGRASGKHYSSEGALPFVVGVDGVGITNDGRSVYFALPRAPFGGMAEQTVMRNSQCIALPDSVDALTAAAIGNPGMSSWAALKIRAQLKVGETVLINGATGSAGHLAIQIAKHLGAKKVIATGRNPEALKKLLSVGADATITLGSDDTVLETELKEYFTQGIDVVLDYLWGPSAEKILIAGAQSGKDGVPTRFVQIGTASAPNINLPGAVLRSSAIQMMGSGIGSVGLKDLIGVITDLMNALPTAKFQIATRAVPLERVGEVWDMESANPRIVLTLG